MERLATILQQLIDAEATAVIGAGRYERLLWFNRQRPRWAEERLPII